MMKNQKGTSLVSVIVSFAVLMIVMLLLQVSISASGRYAAKANELWAQVTEGENAYAKDEGIVFGVNGKSLEMKLVGKTETEDWGIVNIEETKNTDEYKIYYIK